MNKKNNYKLSLITHSKAIGGANIAANRLSNNLKKKFKIETIYCNNSNILKYFKFLIARILKLFIKRIFLNSLNLFSRISINKLNGKILFLNWIGEETISLDYLISVNKPIIWTAHDIWPFTSTEHFLKDPSANYYLEKNYENNFLKKLVLKKKKKLFKKKNIILIENKKWLYNFSRKNPLTKNTKIFQIYSPIETNIWRRVDSKKAKLKLKLDLKKNYILLGSHGGLKNYRKGGDLFIDSLKYLENFRNEFDIIVLGNHTKKIDFINNFKFHYRKFTSDKNEQVLYHSAVNLTVSPSRGESIPQFIVETILCNNPVVSFDIGGMSEIIDHKKNGFLVSPFNKKRFAQGIIYCLKNCSKKNLLNNRKKIVKMFDENKNLNEYSKVIKSFLKS